MKKILFPTEFSPQASQSFLYALNLAKQIRASVTLMHAFTVPLNAEKNIIEAGHQKMGAIESFYEAHTPVAYESIPVNFMTRIGLPGDTILEVAEEEEIDFIVMGMKGKTNALASYFGSVALDVVSRTDRPVFLIPSSYKFKPIRKIVCAFDLKMRDLVGIRQMIKLIGKLDASITCAYFNKEEDDWLESENAIVFLIDLLKHHPKYKSISFFSGTGKFEPGIQEFVIKNKVDLLVTQSYKRNWKFRFVEPSKSNKIARKINIPMLVLKEKKLVLELEKK